MIKTIKLHNCTPYQQVEVSDCKKINFIFGANGSGKSTISSFLAGTLDSRFSSSSIEWESEAHERIEVYNKAFRQANLQQEMQGVFTLGSATIEDIREIDLLKQELSEKTKDWEGACNCYTKKSDQEKPAREARFKEDAWVQILKGNEIDFQKAFEGYRGSKDKFLAELNRRIAGIHGHEGTICERQVLLKRAQTLYASKPERQSKFEIDIDGLLNHLDELSVPVRTSTISTGFAIRGLQGLISRKLVPCTLSTNSTTTVFHPFS